MADITIQDVRKKYPQYKDLSDEQLAQGLHKKYYSDMPFDEFSKRIGLNPAQQTTPRPIDQNIPQPILSTGMPLQQRQVGQLTNEPVTDLQEIMTSIPDLFAALSGGALGFGAGAVTEGATMGALGQDKAAELRGRVESQFATPFRTEAGEQSAELVNKATEATIGKGLNFVEENLGPAARNSLELLMLSQGLRKGGAKGAAKQEFRLNKVIDEGIEKGLKPPKTSMNLNDIIQQKEFGRRSVTKIAENKTDLVYKNSAGEIISEGHLPKNTYQLAEAVQQVKDSIYQKYAELAQKANDLGVTIDYRQFIDDLRTWAGEEGLQASSMDTAKLALDTADRLESINGGRLSAIQAQKALKNLNERLGNKPTHTETGAYSINNLHAKYLRQELDRAITQAVGEGYAELKGDYGALKELEQWNTKALQKELQNTRSIFDVTNPFTSYEVIRGIVSGNPSITLAGVGARALSEAAKFKNRPSRIIKNMFKNVDKMIGEMPKQSFKFPKSLGVSGAVGMERQEQSRNLLMEMLRKENIRP